MSSDRTKANKIMKDYYTHRDAMQGIPCRPAGFSSMKSSLVSPGISCSTSALGREKVETMSETMAESMPGKVVYKDTDSCMVSLDDNLELQRFMEKLKKDDSLRKDGHMSSQRKLKFTPKTVSNMCGFCFEENPDKRCSRCKRVKYCSQACQKADWKNHKGMCNLWVKHI